MKTRIRKQAQGSRVRHSQETEDNTFRIPHSVFRIQRAFTLIEILVTIGLLSFIILGLLAMFNQVQRAFTTSMTQSDILEAGRAATDLLVRDLEQMTPSQRPYLLNGNQVYSSTNFYAEVSTSFVPPLLQGMPGTTSAGGSQLRRTNIVENFFFLTRQNQDWIGTGYAVIPLQNDSGVGTLYRFTATIPKLNQMWSLFNPGQNYFTNNPISLAGSIRNAIALAQISASQGLPITNSTVQISRIADGIVHLRVQAFDTNGIAVTPLRPGISPAQPAVLRNTDWWWDINLVNQGYVEAQSDYYFRSNAVPAALELELGVLEPKLLQRYRSFADITNPTTRQQTQLNYLSNYVAQVHIFRQRVAIRNVDPSAYQ